ncbi:MAG: hypothetical protein ABS81_04075 [Pseudonocardia sp. SCN 72-86]|nr:MAG: hypothetical protein ABS81_04075 [Pseudonocardia sp. SCN 72-86]
MDDDRWVGLPALEARTVPAAIRRSVAAVPDRIALTDEVASLTYAELDSAARRFSAGLAGLGAAKGTRVLTMMDNHADSVVVWLALSYLGAVSVPVNTAYVGPTLEHVMGHSDSTIAVVDADHLGAVQRAAAAVGGLRTIVVRTGDDMDRHGLPSVAQLLQSAELSEPVPVDPWDLHSVMYTSGTTSLPKGVLVPHALTYTRAAIYQESCDVGSLVELCVLPFFHVVGQCRGVVGPLLMQGRAVMRSRFSASRFWTDCRDEGVTSCVLMGAMARFLMLQPPADTDREHNVRVIHTAGADLTGFSSRFGVQVSSGYGMTEIGTITRGDDPDPGGCGTVHPEIDYQLVDEHERPVPTGTAGELVVRNTVPWTFTTGYLGDPAATTDLWRNLWLHTGDLFIEADDGTLTFVGRSKFVIRRRGENISPSQVEVELCTHPGVAEAAVVGVPADEGEEEVLALVVAQPGTRTDPAELLEHLSGRLPYFMIPRYVEFREALPKTPTHKIDVGALRVSATTTDAWDRDQAGIRVTRAGVVRAGS